METKRLAFSACVALAAVTAWLGSVAPVAHAQHETFREGDVDATKTLSPYFFVEGPMQGAETFPLESTKIAAHVAGVIAEVTVTQTYRNDGTMPIHARYVFPASTRAAVHGMQIQVGNQRVVAKIRERERATQEFEKAKAAGKTASLLEQERPNVFTMAVANILPRDRVVVELRYSELLVPREGVYEFVYPTVVGPRYANQPEAGAPAVDRFVKSPYLHEGDKPPTTFEIALTVSAGVPIAEVRCATHPVNVAWDNPSLAHVTLSDTRRFAGDRDFIVDYRLAGAQIETGLLLYEGVRENHFLLMVQPPARVSEAQIPPREYVFVLDVSGSMEGFPLDTAKALLRDLVGQLRPTDVFNVVLFSGDSHLFAPRSLPATQANLQHAIQVISGQRGGGGTELEAALRDTLALPRAEHVSRTVVVMTDGYIAQERGAFQLVADNLDRTNLFAFGIGSSVNRHLIEGLARAGQGEPFVVTDPSEAPREALRFRRTIESPVLTNVSVRMHGFDAYDVEPPRQPDLFAERPVVVFGKWRGARAGTIEVAGRGATGPFAKTVSVAATTPRAEHAALKRLWARSRILRLSDMNVDGSDAGAVREVTALGLNYSLLTAHTSFIAVVEVVRNTTGGAAPVDQPLPLPLGVTDLAVGGDYAMGAEPEFWLLLALVLVGFAVTVVRRRGFAARRAA
jgi:Ca-activated chloride channel family protein